MRIYKVWDCFYMDLGGMVTFECNLGKVVEMRVFNARYVISHLMG